MDFDVFLVLQFEEIVVRGGLDVETWACAKEFLGLLEAEVVEVQPSLDLGWAGAGVCCSPLDLLDVGPEFLGLGLVPESFSLLALGSETIFDSPTLFFVVH